MKKIFVFLVFALMFALAAPAMAGTIVHNDSFILPASGTGTLTFDQFNEPYTLLSVYLYIDGYEQANVEGENDEDTPQDITAQISGSLTTSDYGLSLTVLLYDEDGPVTLQGSDDNPRSGPDYHDFGLLYDSDSDDDTITTGLSPFIGSGTVDIDVLLVVGYQLAGGGDSTLWVEDYEGGCAGTLIYTYSTIPEPSTLLLLAPALFGVAGVVRHRLKK